MPSLKNWDNKTWISSRKYIESFNNFILKQKKLNKDSKILDIGCGRGKIVGTLSSKLRLKNKPIGIDITNHKDKDKRIKFKKIDALSFFLKNKDKFDLIFIDGLHTYKQVKKDIKNSLDCISEKGFILIHDCFPLSYYDQAVPRAQRKWNGDVWKAIIEFRTENNINVMVGAFDNGIGLIYKRKNKNKLFLVKNFNEVNYEDYYNNYFSYLNLVDSKTFFNEVNDFE